MTQHRDFKQRVRARMQKTGERYSTARAHVLAAQILEPQSPGLPQRERSSPEPTGYPFLPGVCRDTAAVRNMLQASGVRGRARQALSEAMVTGLAGGVGFLYIVFEYKGTPPLLSVLMRHDTAADQFVIAGLRRLVPGLEVTETSSAAKAEKSLNQALDSGCPATCVVDLMSMFQVATPGLMKGMAPAVVVATGTEGDDILVDTGEGRARRVPRAEFAQARAAYKKSKNRMGVMPAKGEPVDLARAIDDAIDACLDRYENAPYKGFASNFGFAGMEKWANLLTDEKDPKGWPRLFPEGPAACLGLRRAYQGIEYEMTGPSAGRALYAQFLREAADECKHTGYAKSGDAFEESAARWSAISSFIAACGVREVRTGCELLDAYSEMLDANASERDRTAATTALNESADACSVSRDQARGIYRELAGLVRRATQAERAAVASLKGARAARQ